MTAVKLKTDIDGPVSIVAGLMLNDLFSTIWCDCSVAPFLQQGFPWLKTAIGINRLAAKLAGSRNYMDRKKGEFFGGSRKTGFKLLILRGQFWQG
jgi:hypothetical protein